MSETLLWPGLLPLALIAVVWSVWLARRKGPRAGGWRWLPWFAGGVPLLSVMSTVWMLWRAFSAVATVDASEKAAHLAASIDGAMTATVAGYVAVWLVLGSLTIGTALELRPATPVRTP